MSAPAEQADPTLRLDDLLERCLEAFLPSAPLDDASRLREFLPQPLDSDTESQARFLVGELVKLDMAAVAEIGGLPRLERYADALPDLLSLDAMPFDLVIEEYQLRREAGKDPKQSEYAQRFPQHAELLAQFSCDAPTVAPTGKPAAAPAELEPAETIDDFAIVQPLGKGAFAHVYLARQQSMQRLVALKVSAGKGDEPQALAQFDHPNIVRVFDQRMLNGGKTHLLYMQYLPGGTLADVVKRARWTPLESRSGAILLEAVDDNLLNAAQQAPDGSTLRAWLESAPWPTAVAWLGVQLARALDEAHAHGVLHRDVKPANVLLSAEGVPKLADFNVSFAGAAGRAGAAASLGGSIGYMAPEHLRAIGGLPGTSPEDVVEPADFYSLAVLLWELWQGRRPFDADGRPESWTDAVAQQIVSRECDLVEPERTGQSSERVLEETLRQTLVWHVDERPASGAELAGRLRLALHPEAAALFDPPPGNWRKRILSMRVLLVTAIAILTPNIVSGVFNYLYNESVIIRPHGDLVDDELVSFTSDFEGLATTVNSVAFPLGAALLLWFSLPIARAIRAVKRGEEPPADSLDSLFALPRRAALIGGTLWGIASLVYPLVMRAWHPAFPFDEAWHFCLSLLVCGGVAAVYPYFLLAVVATGVYYPRLVRRSMQDPAFDERGELLRREAGGFLLVAAAIPLLAIALLISIEDMQVNVIRVAVVASLVGLFAAFSTYRYVLSTWDRMAPVLSPSRSAGTPGLSEHQ